MNILMPVISISGDLCCLVKIFTTAVNAVEKERKTQRFALTVAPPMRTGPFMWENGFGHYWFFEVSGMLKERLQSLKNHFKN